MKRCPQCQSQIKGHPNKKFCGSLCKDRYHNTHNPRGYGLQSREWEDEFGEPCFVGVSDFDNTSCQNEE